MAQETRRGTTFMLMAYPHPELQFTHVLPYGALIHDHGVQFVIFSRSATAMRMFLYDKVEDTEPAEILKFDRETDYDENEPAGMFFCIAFLWLLAVFGLASWFFG